MSESDNGLPETDAAVAAQRENELPLVWKVRSAVQSSGLGFHSES